MVKNPRYLREVYWVTPALLKIASEEKSVVCDVKRGIGGQIAKFGWFGKEEQTQKEGASEIDRKKREREG